MKIGANKGSKKVTKNDKYLKTVIFCHSPMVSCNEGWCDGGFNFIFGHIFTNIYRKIKTGFYFTISSLALQALTILYFSY